jgi:hypothetical protein
MSILPRTPRKDKTETDKGTPIHGGGHVVGYVRGDTFYKVIAASKHVLRQPPALAFSVESLEQADALGALKVDITDRESGRHYLADLATIRAYGFVIDRGYGRQLACRLTQFVITDPNEPPKPPRPKIDRTPIKPLQSRLF